MEATCIELGLTEYTAEDVVDTLELHEAGGIISWLARAYSGKDRDLPAQIEKELESVKTAERKKEMLEEIDHFIKEAEASNVTAAPDKHMPPELKPGRPAWPGTDLFKARQAWFAKNAHTGTLGHAYGQFGHQMASGIIGNIIKRINAVDGTIEKYIAELKRVRAKVAAHKVEGK